MNRMTHQIQKFLRWTGQKKNNRGSSLILVVVALGMIGILVSVILSTSLMNYRMKATNLNSAKNFYSADSALDEIKTTLSAQIATATSSAYVSTVSNFNNLDADSRTGYFQSDFVSSLRKVLSAGETDSSVYSTSYLNTLLKTAPYNSATGLGCYVDTPSAGISNALNITTKGMILKNVRITSKGSGGYFSQITTDIVLNFPDIAFSQTSEMPELLNYSMLADQNLNISLGSNVTVKGNAYIGSKGAEITNSKLKFEAEDSEEGLLISGSAINVKQGSTFQTTGMELWADSILVDSSAATLSGTTYLKNDLVIDNTLWNADNLTKPDVSATLSGALYAFGNIASALGAESQAANTSLINSDPAAYSSSVIVNGINATVDFQNLKTMVISGNSYIAATREKSDSVTASAGNTDVSMGESLSLKANQRAYLIPAECVAPGVANGGVNPMTSTQYTNLMTSLAGGPLVNFDTKITAYGKTLHELGVSSYQTEFFPIAHIGSMVYLFMKFDTQAQANTFFSTYYTSAERTTELHDRLDLYTRSVLLPSSLTDASKADSSNVFYYNGNIVVNDSSSRNFYVPSLTSGVTTNSQYQQIAADESSNQDTFAALNKKLIRQYYKLSDTEKNQDVYANLIESMINAEYKYNIGAGSSKVFVSDKDADDPIAAVVVNGDYVYNGGTASGLDASGNTVSGRIVLIIASGNVTVKKDFSGLIVSGNTIQVSGATVSVTPDTQNVGVVLGLADPDGVRAADYIKDSDAYVIGGLSQTNSNGSNINFSDLITYENWTKQ